MESPLKVTLFMAISVNGLIGRPDGRGDYFTDVNWTGFVELAKRTGALVWGRRTHDHLRSRSPHAVGELDGVKGIVLTSSRSYRLEPGWQVADSPRAALAALEQQGLRQTLVVGGALVNAAFAREGLIDEVVLFVESVIIGRGLPLLAPEPVDIPLELLAADRLTQTVLRLHYRVRGRG